VKGASLSVMDTSVMDTMACGKPIILTNIADQVV